MPELSPSVARLRSFLEEADIPSGVLRRDPEGTTWLPAELRALVDADPTCHEELRRFVDREIELFGSVRQKGDALFTDRVLKAAAPVEIAGAGLDGRVRGWILAFAYALATGVAYLMLAPLLGLAALGTWTSQLAAATGLTDGAAGVGGSVGASNGAARAVAVLVGAAILVVAVAFMPSRRHTTPPA